MYGIYRRLWKKNIEHRLNIDLLGFWAISDEHLHTNAITHNFFVDVQTLSISLYSLSHTHEHTNTNLHTITYTDACVSTFGTKQTHTRLQFILFYFLDARETASDAYRPFIDPHYWEENTNKNQNE